MKTIALLMISAYQRYVSPRKGYKYAYAALTGNYSCSEFVKKSIFRHGIGRGVSAFRYRMVACSLAYTATIESDGDQKQNKERCGDDCKPYICGSGAGCAFS
jgi:putative component of membrane protein insertase Oxa1/YidC/SpoIIIJ protein YidD